MTQKATLEPPRREKVACYLTPGPGETSRLIHGQILDNCKANAWQKRVGEVQAGKKLVGLKSPRPETYWATEPFPASKPFSTWKRLLDLFFILLSSPVAFPLMLVIAAIIKFSSNGPIFYEQERVGYGGRRFKCLKFRSMRVNADTRAHQRYMNQLIHSEFPMQKLDNQDDSRLLRGSKLLRSSGLDELPQLINVLRNEMSLVGPRPCTPYEYEQYADWQKQRCEGVPGLTGLWQVSGKNKTTFNQMVHLDILYLRKRSIWLDLMIIIKTPFAIVSQFKESRKKGPSESSVIAYETSQEPSLIVR